MYRAGVVSKDQYKTVAALVSAHIFSNGISVCNETHKHVTSRPRMHSVLALAQASLVLGQVAAVQMGLWGPCSDAFCRAGLWRCTAPVCPQAVSFCADVDAILCADVDAVLCAMCCAVVLPP